MFKTGHTYYFKTNYHDIGFGKLITIAKVSRQRVLIFEIEPNEGIYGVTYNVLANQFGYAKVFEEVEYIPQDNKRYYTRVAEDIVTYKQVKLYKLLEQYE